MTQQIKTPYQINPSKLDWYSENTCLFFNQKHADKTLFLSFIPRLPNLKGHVWLATSGRTQQKWVALSKKALLVSAHAVNQHLQVSSKDRWGLCLPLFHVGGLAITARAHLSQSPCFIYRQKWKATGFYRFLKEKKISLCSLVPTQVYDLVQAQLSAPRTLRLALVGGESLSPSLYQSARALKWPLLPSYGLTECSSQVATAEPNSLKDPLGPIPLPALKILPHVQVKIIKGEIALKSESLLTGFVPLSPALLHKDSVLTFEARPQAHHSPKVTPASKAKLARFHLSCQNLTTSWYKTGDKGKIQEACFLQIDKSESIKILGEKVDIPGLKDRFTRLLLKHSFTGRAFLLPVPSKREGWQITVATDTFDKKSLMNTVHEFNQTVSPFEKIKAIYIVPTLPLTSLSKLNQPALLKKLVLPENLWGQKG